MFCVEPPHVVNFRAGAAHRPGHVHYDSVSEGGRKSRLLFFILNHDVPKTAPSPRTETPPGGLQLASIQSAAPYFLNPSWRPACLELGSNVAHDSDPIEHRTDYKALGAS